MIEPAGTPTRTPATGVRVGPRLLTPPAYLVPAPTVEQVRAWCEVGPNVVTDEVLAQVLNAEIELQAARLCDLSEVDYPNLMPSSLCQALMRRVARQLAARGVPLGLSGANEFGPVVLPSYDTEIERLEAPWRTIAVG